VKIDTIKVGTHFRVDQPAEAGDEATS